MIEIKYDESKNNLKLPKNIRQIGKPGDKTRIYIEDYVVTYINQMTADLWKNSGWPCFWEKREAMKGNVLSLLMVQWKLKMSLFRKTRLCLQVRYGHHCMRKLIDIFTIQRWLAGLLPVQVNLWG